VRFNYEKCDYYGYGNNMLFWKNKREVTFNLFKNRGGLVRLNVISTKEFHTYFMEENKL